MTYSTNTPIEDLPCYLPEIGGYFMSKTDQRAVYLGLKNDRKEISNEIAAIEAVMKAAGPIFGALSRLLTECHIETLNWSTYQKLISELPSKASRYGTLKLQLAAVEIVPSLVDAAGSRGTARYATWTC